MSDTVIQVEDLGKLYRIGRAQQRYDTLRDSLAAAVKRFNARAAERSNEDTIWALKGVSFEVKQGERLGIIGRNGAGKSTLLKILSRITEPTTGRVRLRGRVASLLEVGTGFHPELTGRENIYLNGAILGMSRAEIGRKFDEIVAFAEVEKFLDTPVKRYSSGMYVRLAFAVAAHLEPEILLIDEVLAVGDVAFQKKCLGKMGDVAKEGRTILFVSHNMAAVENLCARSILMNGGRADQQGDSREIIHCYLQGIASSTIERTALAARTDRTGNGRIKLTSFHVEDTDGQNLIAVRSGMDVALVIGFHCASRDAIRSVDPGLSISTDKGQLLFVFYRSYAGSVIESVPERGEFRCVIPKIPLAEGRYLVGARVTVNGQEADWPRDGIGYLEVEAGDFYGSGRKGFEGSAPILVSGTWEVRTHNALDG